MQPALRFLLVSAAVVSATVPVALAGAEPATGGDTAVGKAGQTLRAVPADVEAAAAVADAALAEARTPPPSLIATVRPGSSVVLRGRPRGPAILRVGDRTEFGSGQRLGVARRHGRWLGVTTPSLPNGRLGWIDRRGAAVTVSRTAWSIHADVSRRSIVLRFEGKAVRRMSAAVGRPGSPTPTGRFAVTDKIAGDRFGPYYGCCILAISATQPNTPPGWTGGNRMAIHGTDVPGSVGAAASAGCLRAADADLQVLMDRVPVGTPVVIRS
jgi:L,D-transpeptidase catalytic domain